MLALSVSGERLAAGLHNLGRLNWSRDETFFALAMGTMCALSIVGVVRAQRRWVQTLCLCSLLVISVADFYHAYGSFQRGHVSPDEVFPETNRLFPLLKDYREQRGPFRFGQIIRGQLGEELATFRNLPYFHDFLEVPEGYTSFYLDAVARFQGITNEEAKIAIQNIRVAVEEDEHGKYWLGTRTNSLPRAKFFARSLRYDSLDALLRALERGEIDWRSEAAVYDFPSADLSHGDEQNQVAGTNDEVRFDSITPESYSITYNLSRPGIILVSQAFYPGWVAANGRVKLIEVFGAFQGIAIPEAGRGQILVRFSPLTLKLGSAITIISIVTVVSLVFGKWGLNSRNH